MIKAGEKPVLPSDIAETRQWLDAELEKMKCEQANSGIEQRSTPETEPGTASADSQDVGWWPGSV